MGREEWVGSRNSRQEDNTEANYSSRCDRQDGQREILRANAWCHWSAPRQRSGNMVGTDKGKPYVFTIVAGVPPHCNHAQGGQRFLTD